MEYLIALDIGTSGTKASLFSAEGQMLSSCTEGYEVYYGKDGAVEQDPEEWWNAIVKAVRYIAGKVNPADVAAISFSGQMMGCLPVDRDGKPLRRAIIWADTRSREEENELKERLGEAHAYDILGHRISCNYTIEKLMWVKKHEPEKYAAAWKIFQAKDYIAFRMTGHACTDYSDGSGTNAMDLRKKIWSQEIFDAAGVDMNKMPELISSVDVVGTLTHEAAEILGLPETVKVVEGGGDGPCATLGSGCIRTGQFYLTFGTSAWIGGTTDEPRADKNHALMTFAHVIPGRYCPTGTMQAAGSSYSYIKNTFCREEIAEAEKKGIGVYDILNKMAEEIPAGADNLMYLPYPTGERSPRWNPYTTGAFLGITMEHTKAHYIRAVLEGIALNMNIILEAQRENAEINDLILTGGGAKGDIVAHILADVTGCRITRPDHVEEATSMAAAVLAGVGSGIYSDFDVINEKYLHYGEQIEPDAANHEIYRKSARVFEDAYQAMVPIYRELRDHDDIPAD